MKRLLTIFLVVALACGGIAGIASAEEVKEFEYNETVEEQIDKFVEVIDEDTAETVGEITVEEMEYNETNEQVFLDVALDEDFEDYDDKQAVSFAISQDILNISQEGDLIVNVEDVELEHETSIEELANNTEDQLITWVETDDDKTNVLLNLNFSETQEIEFSEDQEFATQPISIGDYDIPMWVVIALILAGLILLVKRDMDG